MSMCLMWRSGRPAGEGEKRSQVTLPREISGFLPQELEPLPRHRPRTRCSPRDSARYVAGGLFVDGDC